MEKSLKTFAFVTLELYPTTVGGVGILLHHTISALLAEGMQVILYLDLNPEEIIKFDLRDRHSYPNPHLLYFYDVRAMSESIKFCNQLYENSEQARSVMVAHAILKTQGNHQIDLIEFYDYCGPAYHYLSYNCAVRRPVAIRLHNTTELIERGTRSAFLKTRLYAFAMERAQLTMADVLLCPGALFLKEEINKIYSAEIKNQTVAIAPPMHSSIGEVRYSVNSNKVLFYGRLSTFKGLDTFINGAVLALRDKAFINWLDKFLIVGPDETVASALTLDEIKSVIPKEMMCKFKFVGRVDHNQLLRILEEVSFACFANRMESFCYAAHELYTAGIPVVVSNRPAFRDHFSFDDVVFFNGTAQGLASAMNGLASDPEGRVRLSNRALNKQKQVGHDLYIDFARIAQEQLASRTGHGSLATESNQLTVFILSDGSRDAENSTLVAFVDAPVSVFVLRLSSNGEVTFAGLRWSLPNQEDLLAAVAPSCIFVRAGDICKVDVLLEAAAHLLEDDRVGAIALWCEINGQVRSALHAFVPEFAATLGPGLRTLIRVDDDLTLVELLRSGSFTDETSLLLAQRARSRGIVEKPIVGVTIHNNVILPPARMDVSTDYDRMSLTYLALSSGLILSAGAGARDAATSARSPLSPYNLVSIRAIDSFGSGEMWLLRVFRQRGAVHEAWSTTQQFGDWTLVREPHSPAGGALKTYDGEISFWADNDYGIEFLFGPFCGGAEIRWRDSVYRVKLKIEHVTSSIVWLNDLIRGLFLPPVAEALPITPIGTSPLSAKARSWIELNVSDSTRILLLILNSAQEYHKSLETAACRPEDLVDGQNISPADLAFALLAALRRTSQCEVHLPFGLLGGPAVAELILQSGLAKVVVVADDGSVGCYDYTLYRQLAKWTGVLGSHGASVTVMGSSDDIIHPLGLAGAKIIRRGFRLPPCRPAAVSYAGEIDLVVLSSKGLVDNVAHMVVAGVFLSQRGIKVATMYLGEEHWHAGSVCDTLAAARTYVSYQSLERVVSFQRKRPLIACAVYPDPAIPELALKALSLGTPTLIGPVGLSERFQNALGDMSVAYWEDSRDIADALANLVLRQDSILAAYNLVVSQPN